MSSKKASNSKSVGNKAQASVPLNNVDIGAFSGGPEVLPESLINNEKRFRALVENGADVIVILSAEGKPTYVSPSISKVLGYTEAETLALNLFDVVHPEDREAVGARMLEVMANPGVAMQGHTARIKHKDGSWRWLEATVTNLLDDPNINGIVDNFRDVTERIEAEIKLKNSEEKYRYIFNLSPMPKWIYHLQTYQIIDVNLAAEKHYGYSRNEFLSMNIRALHPVSELPKLQHTHTEIAKMEGVMYFGTVNHQKKDGTIIQVDVTGQRIQYDGQDCITVVCIDVTEKNELQHQQKQLLNTLEQRNSFIERVIEELPIGIAVNKITDGQATIVNKAFGKIYGWEHADLTDIHTFFEKVYPDELYRQEIMSKILEDIKTGDPQRMQWNNIMVIADNGEKRYVNAKNIPLPDQNLMISTVIDVTNEYLRTREIQESEARLAEAQAVAKVGSWETDLVSLNLSWSAESFRIFELDPASFQVTYASFIEHVHPEDRDKVNNALEASLNEDGGTTIEHRIVTPSGYTKIVEERWKIVRNDSGQPIKAVGTCQDITERKQAEEKLKESNQRYAYVTKATFDAVWDWDIFSGKVFWSEAYNDLFGELDQDGMSDIEKVQQRIHPSETEMVLASANLTLSSNDLNWELEHRYRKADGSYAFVQNKAVIVRDINGRALRVIGAMQDITIRKQKERQLKLMESVITNTNDAVLITEAEPLQNEGPAIMYVNDAFTRMTGYTSEEVIGRTPRILQGPKSDRKELDRLSRALQKWEACEITTINYKKNGEEFWINMSISPVADEKGWFTHWIAIERDVTKQKMQELQKQLLAEISRLFNQDIGLKPTLEIVLQNLVQYATINLGEAWLVSADKKTMNLVGNYTTDERSNLFYKEAGHIKSFSEGAGLPGTVWKERKIIMWNSGEMRAEYVRRQAAENAGFTAALGIPLLHNDEVVGVLVFMTAHDVQNLQQYKNLFTELETFLGAEFKRKYLEEELNRIFNTAPDIIGLADFDGNFKRINSAGCELLGYTEQELLSKPSYEFMHPDDRMISVNAVNSLAEGETVFYFENRYIQKDGSIIWLSWTCSSSVEDRLIYAVAKNITETKKLQELLDKANQLARIGSWEIDLTTNELYWSDVTKQIHEVDDDYMPLVETGISFYKEGESRTKIYALIAAAIEKGEAFDEELQLITAKGNERWVRAIGSPEFSEGRCIRVYGSFQDIHERKEANAEIAKSEEKRRLIMNGALDAIISIDTNETITFWNSQAEVIFGWKEEEVMGKPLSEMIIPEPFRKFHVEGIKNYLQTGEGKALNVLLELSAIRRNGEEFPIELTVIPIKQGGEEFFCAFIRDITQRKKAEREIKEANERFEKVTEATNDAIWDWDIETQTFFRGKGIEIFFGESALKSLAETDFWTDRFYEDDLLQIKQSLEKAIQNPAVNKWEMDYRIINEDKEICYVVDKGIIIRDKEGKAIRMVGAMTDISERKRNEEKLRQSNERFEKVTEATNDAIWDYDVVNNDLFWGKGFYTLFRYNEEETEPSFELLVSLIHEQDRERVTNKVYQYMMDPNLSNWFEEYRFLKADGSYAFVIDRATFLRDSDGKVLRVVGAMTDITYRKEYEESLRKLNASLDQRAKQLAVSNAELEQFAYIASHDLQEPLRMITSFLTQVDKRYSPVLGEKGKQYIHFAVDGAKRMRQIILDLLEYSRIGRAGRNPEQVNLNELIEEIKFLFKRQIEEKQARISSDRLPVLVSHRSPLRQLFQNLIGNALKYSDANRPAEVNVSVKETDGQFEFCISDNGIGIDREYFEKIFIIFQRLHNKDEYSGTGMGLSISKKIVESLGGKIWVASEEGKGSSFFFTVAKPVIR